MLTISRPLSSGQAQRYHAEEFTSRAQSYYEEAENVRGEWQGHEGRPFISADRRQRATSSSRWL